MKDWKDELKKRAEGFYIGLGDLQSETSFMDGVNYTIDKSKPIIKSLLKTQREKYYYEIENSTGTKEADYIDKQVNGGSE